MRTKFEMILLVHFLAVISFAASFSSASSIANNWLTVDGDYEHTGYKSGSVDIHQTNSLQVVWSNDDPTTGGDSGIGLLVVNSKVYAISDANLRIIDAKTGSLLKSIKLAQFSALNREHVIDPVNGMYFMVDYASLYAVNITSGHEALMWKKPLNNDYAYLLPNPATRHLYVATYEQIFYTYDYSGNVISNVQNAATYLAMNAGGKRLFTLENLGSLNRAIAELGINGGRLIWNLPVPGKDTQRSPALSGNLAIIDYEGNKVAAYDVNSKTVKWISSAISDIDCVDVSIVTDGRYVFRCCGKACFKFDIESGQLVMSFNTSLNGLSPLLLDNAILVPFATGIEEYGLELYDTSSGAKLATLNIYDDFIFSNVAFYDGMFYAQTRGGAVIALKPTYVSGN